MSTAPDPVADAETEAAEAENLADALEERVRDGDDTVTPEHVAQQRGLSRFARLRVDAARRKADKEREKQRRGKVDAITAEIDQRADDTARLVELRDTAEQALEAFVQACADHNQWVGDTVNRMRRLDVPPAYGKGAENRDPADPTWTSGAGGSVVRTPDRTVHTIRAGAHVVSVVAEVANRHSRLAAGGKDLRAIVNRYATPAQTLKRELK